MAHFHKSHVSVFVGRPTLTRDCSPNTTCIKPCKHFRRAAPTGSTAASINAKRRSENFVWRQWRNVLPSEESCWMKARVHLKCVFVVYFLIQDHMHSRGRPEGSNKTHANMYLLWSQKVNSSNQTFGLGGGQSFHGSDHLDTSFYVVVFKAKWLFVWVSVCLFPTVLWLNQPQILSTVLLPLLVFTEHFLSGLGSYRSQSKEVTLASFTSKQITCFRRRQITCFMVLAVEQCFETLFFATVNLLVLDTREVEDKV